MYRLTDRQVALVVYGAMIQAADDYHEWKRYEQRGWKTLGRVETENRKGSPSRPMKQSEINHFTKWGEDARDWLLGQENGGLSFRQCCDALGYDWVWLGNRIMQPSFWRLLNAKAEHIVNVRKAFDDAAREDDDDQEAA